MMHALPLGRTPTESIFSGVVRRNLDGALTAGAVFTCRRASSLWRPTETHCSRNKNNWLAEYCNADRAVSTLFPNMPRIARAGLLCPVGVVIRIQNGKRMLLRSASATRLQHCAHELLYDQSMTPYVNDESRKLLILF